MLSQPVLRIGTKDGRPYADIVFESAPRRSVDERIAKIDAARANLVEALDAINELKSAANANKADLEAALEQLGQTQAAKTAAERELNLVREIADSDVEVFQRLAGVPSRSQIAKERALGFVFGVAASLLASGLWWSIAKLWPIFKS